MDVTTTSPCTSAAQRAATRWQSNLCEIGLTQPQLVEALGDLPSHEWLFGRDGSLTARDGAGRWWAGCSLPLRAGRAMLKRLEVRGVVGCLLAPTLAGQVTAALERMAANQALIVVQPDALQIKVLLACEDFAEEIRRHRLWFVTGTDWARDLADLFETWPGLPTPSQFVRLPVTGDDVTKPLIREVERVVREANSKRSAAMSGITRRQSHRMLVVAPTQFRLWNDAGHALIESLRGEGVVHLDPDDPAQASALGLARAVVECGIIVVPNRGREDLPAVVPGDVNVVTWVTEGRIPSCVSANSGDRLLVVDEDWIAAAVRAGWSRERVGVATWPKRRVPAARPLSAVMICDTNTLDVPVAELSASSHHVVWESVRDEILRDPFGIRGDVEGLLRRHREKFGVAEEGFNRELFINRLVAPAYQQAIAERLLAAKVPLRIFGSGWEQLPRFEGAYCGSVRTREEFYAAAVSARVLVYPWPVRCRHEIDAIGVNVGGPWESAGEFGRWCAGRMEGGGGAGDYPELSGALLGKVGLRPSR